MGNYGFGGFEVTEYGEDVCKALTLTDVLAFSVYAVRENGAYGNGMIVVDFYFGTDESYVCHCGCLI